MSQRAPSIGRKAYRIPRPSRERRRGIESVTIFRTLERLIGIYERGYAREANHRLVFNVNIVENPSGIPSLGRATK